ncbi:MAG TPA: glycoside hydrolase family 172 protein [Hanamia sp.]|nr:glycoside hydrolase family 172 protein [Hanamia sp.]
MKILLLYSSMLLSFNNLVFSQVVSFRSLLRQMTDNTQLARFPTPFYQSLESSSYNRASVSPFKKGWFADSDGTGYIRKDTMHDRTEYVIMEHKGPGCITRMWTPYFYYSLNNREGPNVSIYIDGNKMPVIKGNFIQLLTGRSFVHPPFANLTTRAGVFYLPIPFSKSCKITLDKKPFYYCIAYRAYSKETKVKSFSIEEYKRSSPLIKSAGIALIHPGHVSDGQVKEIFEDVRPGDSIKVMLPTGANAVRNMEFKINHAFAFGTLRNVLLKMTFDGKETVWCPLGDFFCSADTTNNFHTKFMMVNDNTMNCRWVMPYHSKAKITLVNYSGQDIGISIKVQTSSWKWDAHSMYFHTNWCDYGYLPGNKFFDLNFITIKGQGRIVGDALTVLSPGRGWWGEGDEKIYINEKDINRHFPSQFGTGTEDYYGWAGGVVPTGKDTFSIPFGSNVRNGNQNDPRGYNICIRNRILDDIPFMNIVKFDMEASPGVDIRHYYDLLAYSMATYWYGKADAVCNRQPEMRKIKQKLMTLSTLDLLEQQLKIGQIHLDSSYIDKKVNSLNDFSKLISNYDF